jgi:hypothetical protein
VRLGDATGPLAAKRRKALKILGILFTVPSVFLVLFVFGVIIRNERAHDEARCPFVRVEARDVEGGRVADERRRCVEGIEEHRWLLERGAGAPLELGRRRLASDFYAAGRYTWRPFVEQGHARVHVENTGAPPVTYREEIAAGGPVPAPVAPRR